ncbi:hypothetical protein CEXT_2741 [Caerostris extrusa]|uniref:Galectin n=1 Tax=Caerostris extrusa TaxID=172846 RepID=A0AAV4R2M9_CAEEX|nr:hypothetical protein CEXT_2741 [Caerostris extrusa]
MRIHGNGSTGVADIRFPSSVPIPPLPAFIYHPVQMMSTLGSVPTENGIFIDGRYVLSVPIPHSYHPGWNLDSSRQRNRVDI